MRFDAHIAAAHQAGELVVQPRMGFDQVEKMRQGLQAVRATGLRVVGTVTLDSYTRVGDLEHAAQSIREGRELNGYPIVSHGVRRTRQMLDGLQGDDFPIQVRHGSARPEHIFAAVTACGIDATEGGPVSYCLPYGRTPLREAISSWRRCADLAARPASGGGRSGLHIETFGGCMLGQLCPPSMLVAISVLEACFFAQRGVTSLSLSYAQQTSLHQDVGALRALRHLAARHLPSARWHVVLYTYMGVFPRTVGGAEDLLRSSVNTAMAGGAERLIVKTVAEAHRIPTIDENIAALELASRHARVWTSSALIDELHADEHRAAVLLESEALVEAVLGLHDDVGEALRKAFALGYLDIPFCLHRDNAGQTQAFIHDDGSLRWLRTGRLPIRQAREASLDRPLDPQAFLRMLSTIERRYDSPHLPQPGRPAAGFESTRQASNAH
ncbi:MAG: methylaspartate mutase [Rhodobacter sp.]|jgi:methylaspartate mutase epsilon subunit|nr:methylaspartate mutase [Rhodobacter sp.]